MTQENQRLNWEFGRKKTTCMVFGEIIYIIIVRHSIDWDSINPPPNGLNGTFKEANLLFGLSINLGQDAPTKNGDVL